MSHGTCADPCQKEYFRKKYNSNLFLAKRKANSPKQENAKKSKLKSASNSSPMQATDPKNTKKSTLKITISKDHLVKLCPSYAETVKPPTSVKPQSKNDNSTKIENDIHT